MDSSKPNGIGKADGGGISGVLVPSFPLNPAVASDDILVDRIVSRTEVDVRD